MESIKEKLIGAAGSVSGAASIMGSWQVCHSVCLGIVAVLAAIGITLSGMPLAFLTTVAVPFWIAAFVLLLVTMGLYVKKKCISKNMLMFNSGLIIIGIPFQPLQQFSTIFWVAGGILVAASVYLLIKNKMEKKKR